MAMKKHLVRLLKLALTVVILYFLYRQVAGHWTDIKDYEWQVDVPMLCLSILGGLVALLILSGSWKLIIGGFGHRVTPMMAFRIAYLSNLGRYIPGKVWQVFGMLYLARRQGIPPETTTASAVMIQVFCVPASLLVFVLAALIEPQVAGAPAAVVGSASVYVIAVLILAGCAAIILWLQPILNLGNRLLRRAGRPPVVFTGDKKVAPVIFLGYFIAWIVYGAAFWLFIRAVMGASSPGFIVCLGLYNVSYQVGYLMLFAPGGLGPRELVMGAFLMPFIGPLGAAVAIMARIWTIVIETLATAIALAVRK
ncbi:MAG TPA: lysylphosphatidylglycerol synthase transmembrane domain-containing protein [Acidobacteriota bacterium]|nr:lysylphosphatidylglycerol synthase transmembrane domain-containing protein [Acidobacteriota bacterium]